MRTLGCTLLAISALACAPKIPSGVFSCEDNDDCPPSFRCALGSEGAKYCVNGSKQKGSPNAGDRPTDAGIVTAAGNFATLGGRRSNGSITIYDDGFEKGSRTCSDDRRLCATGGFEP